MVEFFKASKGCVNAQLSESDNKFFLEFKPMIEETYKKINKKETIEEINNAIDIVQQQDENNKSVFSLLKLEFKSYVSGYMKITGASKNSLEEPPPVGNWLSKKVTPKNMIKAAKTIVDSLIEALGDVLPNWVKGLLKTLKEVFDFAIGL